MPNLSLVVADAATLAVIDERPATRFEFADALDGLGGWSASLPVGDSIASLQDGRSVLCPVVGTKIMYAGAQWLHALPPGAEEVVTVGGQAVLSFFASDRRTVHSRNGMIHATGDLASDVTWSDTVDAFEIIEDLFAHAATFGGSVPIVVSKRGPGAGGNSGATLAAPLTIRTFERRGILKTVDDVAKEVGIDIGYRYTWANDRPVVEVQLFHPYRGSRSGIVFTIGGNAQVRGYDSTAEGSANYLNLFGAGEGDAMVRGSASAASKIYPAGQWPRIEGAYTDKLVGSAPRLVAAGAAQVAVAQESAEVLKLEVTGSRDAPLGGYGCGTVVLIDGSWRTVSLQGWWRIVELGLALSETNDPVSKVTLSRVEYFPGL